MFVQTFDIMICFECVLALGSHVSPQLVFEALLSFSYACPHRRSLSASRTSIGSHKSLTEN